MPDRPGKQHGQNWTERAGLTRPRRRLNEPLPPYLQSGLPSDFSVYMPEAGNVPDAAGVAEAARYLSDRKAHYADNMKKGGVLEMVTRIWLRMGMHGQKLTNFRAGVGVNDVVVLPFNPTRAYLFMVNTGALQVNVSFDRGADTVSGIPIPAGGFFEPILGTVSSVHAISTAVGQSLVITEGFYYWGSGGEGG